MIVCYTAPTIYENKEREQKSDLYNSDMRMNNKKVTDHLNVAYCNLMANNVCQKINQTQNTRIAFIRDDFNYIKLYFDRISNGEKVSIQMEVSTKVSDPIRATTLGSTSTFLNDNPSNTSATAELLTNVNSGLNTDS